MSPYLQSLRKRQFLFEELVKRDFKQKYKRTVLGMLWSILSPLMTLAVMNFVFSHLFRRIPHYAVFLFSGTMVFGYFRESTSGGMNALLSNAGIFTKVNVPKYLFLLSKNVSAFINFLLTLCIFFIFTLCNGVPLDFLCVSLAYPAACLTVFNIGVGLVLSALVMFYRDVRYLYDIFTMLLMYCSAIFYSVDIMPARYQRLFLFNPVYVYIKYFRVVLFERHVPSAAYHLLCALYAALALGIGGWIYKKYNHKFLYYV